MTARTTFSTSTPERGVSQRGGTGPGRAEPGPVVWACMLRVYAWMGCGTVDAAWAVTVRGRSLLSSITSYGAAYGICGVRCERGCEAEGAGQQQRTRQTLSSTLLRARSTPRFFICLEVRTSK